MHRVAELYDGDVIAGLATGRPGLWLTASIVILAATAAATAFEFNGLFSGGLDHPAIEYATRPVHNAVTELNARLQRRATGLTYAGNFGYVRSVLEALHVPIESQMVVFSKTSLQQAIISPQHPRSIFFNDSVAVGWVPGEPFVEVAVEDPQQGVIFYTLDQQPVDSPVFTRRDACLNCHESYSSLGVPGTLVRSVFPDANGFALRRLGDFVSDHRSPFNERWGGWYVTGKSRALRHMGNRTFMNSDEAEAGFDGPDLASLESKFDTTSYLSPYSDVVALMVFDHQMHMINLITRVGWEVRFAKYEETAGSSENGKRPDMAGLVKSAANELVDYMLFVNEAPLPGPIQGTSGFTEGFSRRGPTDTKGRSLRQFDLEHRLMRYPCSYMIYSEAFDALPVEAKDEIYRRMWQILSGKEKAAKYQRLSLADREAVVQILRETKPGLPAYFGTVVR